MSWVTYGCISDSFIQEVRWEGPGWYAPMQEGMTVILFHIPGYGADGWGLVGGEWERVYDARSDLGTPSWVSTVEDALGSQPNYRDGVYDLSVPV